MKLAPKNWRDFQHYKDRSPPWIRLQRKLLDDREFHRLPVASRALAPMLWLLASESMDGVFNGGSEELAFRLRSSEKEIRSALQPLLDAGFFVVVQDASTALADRPQVAVPEAEAEAEREADAEGGIEPGGSMPDCPHQEIISAFHAALPSARQVRDWTPARADMLRVRWREKKARQSLEWWARFFAYCAKSKFLTGQAQPSPGRRPFELSLDWLLKAENFVKVTEGAYHEADETEEASA